MYLSKSASADDDRGALGHEIGGRLAELEDFALQIAANSAVSVVLTRSVVF